MLILQTVIEFLIAALLIIGLFCEQKVVAFEDKIIAAIKAKFFSKTKITYKSQLPETNNRNCA